MMHDVTFEAIGYTAHLKHCEQELDEDVVKVFNESSIRENSFPENVVAVISGYITPDDNQNPMDAKVFCSVTLRMNAVDETPDPDFNVPMDLLNSIAEMIPLQIKGTNSNKQPLDIERNSWEVVDVNNAQLAPISLVESTTSLEPTIAPKQRRSMR